MIARTYKVTCLICKQDDTLTIEEDAHQVLDYVKKMLTPFLSFRWRGDLKWGFLCVCGNDSRLAYEEKGDFDKLVMGDPITMDIMLKRLSIPAEKKFKMELI